MHSSENESMRPEFGLDRDSEMKLIFMIDLMIFQT